MIKSIAQIEWLRHAYLRGYESPFTSKPLPSLLELERKELIEHDPTSITENTHWRITEKGIRVAKAMRLDK